MKVKKQCDSCKYYLNETRIIPVQPPLLLCFLVSKWVLNIVLILCSIVLQILNFVLSPFHSYFKKFAKGRAGEGASLQWFSAQKQVHNFVLVLCYIVLTKLQILNLMLFFLPRYSSTNTCINQEQDCKTEKILTHPETN